MYNSVVHSVFIALCNHYYCLVLEHLITPKRNPIHVTSQSPFPQHPQFLATPSLLSVSAHALFTAWHCLVEHLSF